MGDIVVMDDYAHHPTAVKVTVAGIRAQYPGQRLWALFEAESNTSRRQIFQRDYVDAFATTGADRVIFCSPLRKEGDPLADKALLDVDALCADITAAGVPASYIPEVDDIVSRVAAQAEPGDVILAMSGRDFRGLHGKLLKALATTE